MHVGIYQPSQRSGLVDLLVELARYYDATGRPDHTAVAAHLDGALLGQGSPITLVTAQRGDGRIDGVAALVVLPSIVESIGAGRFQCQLKELFVSERCRGDGVGEALLRWTARFAADRGCGRLDWNVKAANAAGIRFYERLGARLVDDRLSYRLDGEALAALNGVS